MDRARLIALAFELPQVTMSPDAQSASADLRVRNKTFAAFTGSREGVVLFKLTLEQQEMLTMAEPEVFARLDQFLGRKGWTEARLDKLDDDTARSALTMSWKTVAPKFLARHLD